MKTVGARRNGMVRAIVPVLLLGAVGGTALWAVTPRGNALNDDLSAPLDGAKSANVDIDSASGNLKIDRLEGSEELLASGTLQYIGDQGLPTRSISSKDGQTTLILRGAAARQPWLRLPWAINNGATEWQIHLNPTVPTGITAHSGGGNVRLDLSGMNITRVAADSSGGNVEVTLPDSAAGVSVVAKSGAGGVTVHVPGGLAARIHASTGLGKVIVDSRFGKRDGKVYQSSGYDTAVNKVEITANSGAGNVTVDTK